MSEFLFSPPYLVIFFPGSSCTQFYIAKKRLVGDPVVKNPLCNARDMGLIPGWELRPGILWSNWAWVPQLERVRCDTQSPHTIQWRPHMLQRRPDTAKSISELILKINSIGDSSSPLPENSFPACPLALRVSWRLEFQILKTNWECVTPSQRASPVAQQLKKKKKKNFLLQCRSCRRDMDSIPGSGRSLEKRENPMDRGAWWAVVRRVKKELDTT